MQTTPDERPSLARMLSSRHSKKVSCETLCVSDGFLHDNLQVQARRFSYFSDDETDLDSQAGGADESDNQLEKPDFNHCSLAHDYLQHARELENRSGKLDNPSDGDRKTAGGNFLSRFLAKLSRMPATRHAKEVERLRKHLRKHPSAIRHSGGLLPHSGPILLHIGSFSGAPNSKVPATVRASSIIPRNAMADKMNAPAGDPFSPKVSCLGRVRNKQKHSGKCTSVASDHIKKYRGNVCCASMLGRRRRKKAHAKTSKKEKKTSGKAMEGDHFQAQSEKTDCGKAFSSGVKDTMTSRLDGREESKIWSLRFLHEGGNFNHQDQESWQGIDSLEPGALSSEFAMDMSRFGSESQTQLASMEANLVTSSVGNGSQRFDQDDKEDSLQAAPQNALLLMRSRKPNNPSKATLSSEKPAPSTDGQETSQAQVLDDLAIHQTIGSSLHTYAEVLDPLPEAQIKKSATIADTLGGHSSSLMTQDASATACKQEKLEKWHSLPIEHTGEDRQASLPRSSPEASLWQRRAIEQPYPLNIKRPIIKRPIKAELNWHTTM